MAKLKAPLLSLGASGAIGKSIVFFPWKGLNVAREYVVPSNPKTTGQTTQRGYLTNCVNTIHALQALAVDPLDETDVSAYSLWGSTYPTPRTWFNQMVKTYLDMKVAGLTPIFFRAVTMTPAATQITFKLQVSEIGVNLTTCNVCWGTSKTAMIHTQSLTRAELIAGKAITGMTTKTKYFLQVRPTAPATYIGGYSGIYYDTTT